MCSCVSIRVGWLLSGALFDLPFIYESLGSHYCPAGAKTPPGARRTPHPDADPRAHCAAPRGHFRNKREQPFGGLQYLFGQDRGVSRSSSYALRGSYLSYLFACCVGSRVFTSP
jgi:hypothetical protein